MQDKFDKAFELLADAVAAGKIPGGVLGYVDGAGNRMVRAIGEAQKVPVSRPTSCMFVGRDLRTLAVTSALPDVPEREPLAGAVFLVDVGAQGLPEARLDEQHLTD